MENNFYLTRRAFLDIRNIYEYSVENWGSVKAGKYVAEVYQCFKKIADNADLGNLRKNRSEPFLMYPSGRHFIIYEPYKDGIIIITVINQVRNIENIVQEFGLAFYKEIKELRDLIENQ